MKKVEDYYAPWVKGIPMYISEHIEKAWRDPSLHRMMSNENPLPPSPNFSWKRERKSPVKSSAAVCESP